MFYSELAHDELRHVSYFPYFGPEASIQQMLVLYSNSIKALNALRFIVPQGNSAIYVYREKRSFYSLKLPGNYQKVTVSLDGIETGDFGEEGFFYWTVNPGNHSIKVAPLWPEQGRGWHQATIDIDCKEGQIYFVEQSWKSKLRFLTEFYVHLSVLSEPDKGRREILERNMVLDCLEQVE